MCLTSSGVWATLTKNMSMRRLLVRFTSASIQGSKGSGLRSAPSLIYCYRASVKVIGLALVSLLLVVMIVGWMLWFFFLRDRQPSVGSFGASALSSSAFFLLIVPGTTLWSSTKE